ncbi:O-antigen ligase domain-containing protein [Leptospira bandrabouensis]|uniref:O-antigen ligase domain-containing protein n=3 Tax=Leptospira bandrabouensis TaxID=2484903 RepID=A0A6H3NPQ8_9LEPT|nr:O-antigen ligase domain-containing protein [Leptospira bandrabouensis]TGN12255.1 O-antigen ligase domain-containing protein [Leptospira bandrabouensis]
MIFSLKECLKNIYLKPPIGCKMKSKFSIFFDIFYLVLFFFQFFGETNQRFFRNDAVGIGCLFVVIYAIWLRKKKHFSFYSLGHLFLIILLSNFVFFKIAEYDPIQLFPEKLVIKLTMIIWNSIILFQHFRSNEAEFNMFGPLLAILPCFACINFMLYPVVPIGFAIGLMIRNSDIKEIQFSKSFILFFLIVLLWIFRDWSDDFALVRILLFSEVVIILSLVNSLGREFRQKLIDHILIIFLINSVILLSKMYLDSEFKINSYREDLFLIPVSLLGSNSFLILGLLALSFHESNWRFRVFYLTVLFVSCFFLLLSLSRISIISTGLLFLYIVWEQQKEKINLKFVAFAFISLLLAFVFLLLSEKSLLNVETIGVRFSIWKLHMLSTIYNKPIFGFGFNSEKLIPFVENLKISALDFALVEDYMSHFKTFPLAHNLYFQIFSSTGIFGFSVFLIWIFSFFKYSHKNVAVVNLRKNLPKAILLIWLIHEILDFSSLEIANILILGLLALDVKNAGKSNVKDKESQQVSKTIMVFMGFYFFLFLFFSYRFSKIEQQIFKNHKNIHLSTFLEFTPTGIIPKGINLDSDSKGLSRSEIFMFGERYFFLQLALAYSTANEPKILQQCFDFVSRKEICYAKLMNYIVNEEPLAEYSDSIKILLSISDPFGIYLRNFL